MKLRQPFALFIILFLTFSVLSQGQDYAYGIVPFATSDFSISVLPSTLNVPQGTAATTTVIVESIDNFSSPVSLGVAGLPSGAVAGFGTNPVTPSPGGNASSPLIISIGSVVAIGTYPLIITGTNGTISHSTTLTLKVIGSGDFTIAVTPSSVIVAPSFFTSATVTVTSSGSFSSAVSLTAAGMPLGLASTFGPNPIVPPAGGSASSLMTLSSSSYAPMGSFIITIIGTSGSTSHSVPLTVAITQTGYVDFSLSAAPSSISLVQGTSAPTTITVTSINGFSAPVGLSVSWVGSTPSGVTFTFATLASPQPGGASAVTFTVTASSTAAVGTFTFRVTGTSAFLRHSIDLVVQVSSATRDFTISVSPESLTIVQGQEASSAITIHSVGSFASSVSLTSSGSPSGMTVVFGTNPVTPPAGGTASSSVTFLTSTSISTGTYGVIIVGSSGTLFHNIILTVIVTPVAVSDFAIRASSNLISINPGTSGAATITVVSLNGFSSPVLLFTSWLSAAPEDTTFVLSSSVTPLPGGTATSILRVTAGGSATLGNFTLRVLGSGGALTHTVDVTVRITSQQCIIATATYGSELAPEVQFLRNFRDNMILRTYTGSTFMTTFNAWYYSFSPAIAGVITQHSALTTPMKIALYPILTISKIGAAIFTTTKGTPDAAVILTGLVMSWLIGAVYLTAPIGVVFNFTRLRKLTKRLQKRLLAIVLVSMGAAIVSALSHFTPILAISAPALVLAVMALSAILTTRLLHSVYCLFNNRKST